MWVVDTCVIDDLQPRFICGMNPISIAELK